MSTIVRYEARFSAYRPEIIRREFVKETGSFLILANGRRESKASNDRAFFETWDAARDALLALNEQRVQQARRDLELANARLGNVRGWKAPQ